MAKYEISISFFIEDDACNSIERKDALLDALDNIPEINQPDVYDDGEDWCIDCLVVVDCNAKRHIDRALTHKLTVLLKNAPNETFDYHYMRGLDNDFQWQP